MVRVHQDNCYFILVCLTNFVVVLFCNNTYYYGTNKSSRSKQTSAGSNKIRAVPLMEENYTTSVAVEKSTREYAYEARS